MKGIVREKVREREKMSHPLVHSLNGLSGLGWAQLKPGASSDSPMGVTGVKGAGLSSAVFPAAWTGSWMRNRAAFGLALRERMLTLQATAYLVPQ